MSKIDLYILSLIPIYIAYIMYLGIFMFKNRVRALKSKEVKLNYFKSYQEDVPDYLNVIKNHYSSQFEVPLLFFISCLGIVLLKQSSLGLFIACCLFVVTRLIHSYVHLGSNNLRVRAGSYFLGIIILFGIWISIVLSAL